MNTSVETIDRTSVQSFSKLPIQPRKVKLKFEDITSTGLHANNSVISAFWVGLSSTFPVGEAEFIRSVKLFEPQIKDPKLRKEVQEFARQEAQHSLQHARINKVFDECGFNTQQVEKIMADLITDRAEKWSAKKRLARTVAAEHLTAVMAHFALTYPHVLDQTPQSFRDLMFWHAIEEIEHKSVAFDVYQHCVGDMAYLKRHYFAFAFFEFPMETRKITQFLLHDQGIKSSVEERAGMRQFLFGKEGMFRAQWQLYTLFLKKNFHPWQHDDSVLVEDWKNRLAQLQIKN